MSVWGGRKKSVGRGGRGEVLVPCFCAGGGTVRTAAPSSPTHHPWTPQLLCSAMTSHSVVPPSPALSEAMSG